jgi:sec-independent protein translocase protein TatA
MPFGFHPFWLVILLVIVLIVFGPGKLPELGGAIGKGIREFRKASDQVRDEVLNSTAPNSSEHSSSTPAASSSTPPPAPAEPAKTDTEQKSA